MGVSPAQLHRCRAEVNLEQIADLGHEDRGQHRADARDGLDSVVAQIAGEDGGDLVLDHLDLAIDVPDELAQGVHPEAVGIAQMHVVEQVPSATPNRSVMGTATPSLASTAWTWALRFVRRWTSLAR